MDFEYSQKTKDYVERVGAFMDKNLYPNEEELEQQIEDGGRWCVIPLLEEIKARAKTAGLWNLFLPDSGRGAGLSNLE